MPIQNKAPTPKRQAPIENDPMAKQITDARQAPFVWFDVTLDDAKLSPFAFRLYCHLARRTNGGKTYFFETLSKAAQVCEMSLSTTQRAMRQLEERCFVKLIADPLGYPRTYAITDKAEWDQPSVSVTEGRSVSQTGEVGLADRGGRSHRPTEENTWKKSTEENKGSRRSARARKTRCACCCQIEICGNSHPGLPGRHEAPEQTPQRRPGA